MKGIYYSTCRDLTGNTWDQTVATENLAYFNIVAENFQLFFFLRKTKVSVFKNPN